MDCKFLARSDTTNIVTHKDKLKSIRSLIIVSILLLLFPLSYLAIILSIERHEWVYSKTIEGVVDKVGTSAPPSSSSFYIVKLENGALVKLGSSKVRYYSVQGDSVQVSVYTCANNPEHKDYRLRRNSQRLLDFQKK